MTQTLYIDFESYFHSSEGYTLNSRQKKHVSMLEYIRSPKFKCFGVGLKFKGQQTVWISGHENVKIALSVIDWPNTVAVAHNMKFDGAILSWIYGHTPKQYRCTQAMARAVLGKTVSSHSLASLADYFGLPAKGHLNTDGIRDLTPQQDEELGLYCKHDVDLDEMIDDILMQEFPPSKLSGLNWTMRAFIDPMLCLNRAKLDRIYAEEKARRERIFEEIGIEKKVFSSNDQFAQLLKDRGFEVPMKPSKTTGESIPALALGDEDFQEMVHSENEELADLCEARVAAKSTLLETRSAKFLRLCEYGGLFPFDVNFSGADQTHRFSGGSGAGGNPQNLPMRNPRMAVMREVISAPPGYKVLVGDFANIELRVAAWIAREVRLIQILSNNGDPYCDFGGVYYKRPITKADKPERDFSKVAVLGLDYNMGAERFQHTAKIQTGRKLTLAEADNVVQLFRGTYWHIPDYWETLNDVISYMARKVDLTLPGAPFLRVKNGDIILPSGLRLKYMNLRVSDNMRDWVYDRYVRGKLKTVKLYGGYLLENICQALAGEICGIAIDRAEAAGLRCVGQVHDEILAIVPAARAEEGAAILRKAMETPISWWLNLRIKAEVGYGDDWLSAKKAGK